MLYKVTDEKRQKTIFDINTFFHLIVGHIQQNNRTDTQPVQKPRNPETRHYHRANLRQATKTLFC